MASWLASSEDAVSDAVNLDGGGSSQMWIAGATPNGVVNYPSDNASAEEPTHAGARGCSGGLFVFAPPYNHPPRFQTSPPTDASAGAPYSYDADAIDLDVDDVLTFSLTNAPGGMAVDATTGVVTWTPSVTDPASVPVDLVVSDDAGEQTIQSFVISVSGTVTPADGGVVGAPSMDGGAGAAGTAGSQASADDVDGGCGCRVESRADGSALGWLAFFALGLLRRRKTSVR
jgi:MYXO-CTERM domain-containing protein